MLRACTCKGARAFFLFSSAVGLKQDRHREFSEGCSPRAACCRGCELPMNYLTSCCIMLPQWAFSDLKEFTKIVPSSMIAICSAIRARWSSAIQRSHNSSHDRGTSSRAFLLFPIEGLPELNAKEGRKFFGSSLEAIKLVSRHLDPDYRRHRTSGSAERRTRSKHGHVCPSGIGRCSFLAYSGL